MKTASKVYTALIFIFLYAPIIVLIIFSFNDTDTASRTQFSGFTLRWYQRLFEDRYILEALLNTLIIAVVSAFASTVLGTMAAVGINRMKRMPKKVMMNITNFPMVNPEIVTGVSMMLLFVAAVSLFGGKSLGPAQNDAVDHNERHKNAQSLIQRIGVGLHEQLHGHHQRGRDDDEAGDAHFLGDDGAHHGNQHIGEHQHKNNRQAHAQAVVR